MISYELYFNGLMFFSQFWGTYVSHFPKIWDKIRQFWLLCNAIVLFNFQCKRSLLILANNALTGSKNKYDLQKSVFSRKYTTFTKEKKYPEWNLQFVCSNNSGQDSTYLQSFILAHFLNVLLQLGTINFQTMICKKSVLSSLKPSYLARI